MSVRTRKAGTYSDSWMRRIDNVNCFVNIYGFIRRGWFFKKTSNIKALAGVTTEWIIRRLKTMQ